MDVAGKTSLVTGAAGGIGRAMVVALLAAGARAVVACDLAGSALDNLSSIDPRVITRILDVTDEAAVARLAAECGDVDILINCHGIVIHESYLAASSLDAFRKEMDVNYWGQVLLCRAFAPIVGRGGDGGIVNFLSPLAYVTFPFCAPYCASKAACRVLTEALRTELAKQGTLVMAVCPGTIDTGMMTNLHVPKSSPAGVAEAVVAGLRTGETEIWPGEGAEAMRELLHSNPEAIRAQAARILTVADLTQGQG